MNGQISLAELGQKVGIPLGHQVSLLDVANRIGFTQRPISLPDLSLAVDEFLKSGQKPKVG